MKLYIKASRLSHDVDEYQEWIDYDMKHYGRISKKTLDDIKRAGFTVTRDQYGDYEITASRSIYADEDVDREVVDTVTVTVNGNEAEIYLCHEPDEDYYYIETDDSTVNSMWQVLGFSSGGDDFWGETEEDGKRKLDKLVKAVDGKRLNRTEKKGNASYDVVDATTRVRADTVKKGNKWVNRGDTGEEHGEFKTKKEADAQRRAMFSRGFKGGK